MRNLHPQLLNDCHVICETENSHILLHRNAVIPWVIIVPNTDETEFLFLPSGLQLSLVKQSTVIGQFLLEHFSGSKLNFAGIGNVVPQCHLHVILRTENDACWPLPVWGHLKRHTNYSEQTVLSIKQKITDLLKERF